LLLSVGRLAEEKGHRYLIKAARRVVATYPRIHFLLAGEGELREGLQALADKTGCSNRIHFLGLRNDVPDLMAVADLFVLPSLSEAMPMALLEAMAAGVPIVATAVQGIEQVVTSHETGLIVPPGDSSRLADAIKLILTHPERARRMGRSAQQYVTDNYSAAKQASEYLALYRAVLTPKRFVPIG
jgi:glycosyltransferase involved in cell wall biosynthesis